MGAKKWNALGKKKQTQQVNDFIKKQDQQRKETAKKRSKAEAI